MKNWIDNSMRKTFADCERKFYYSYVMNIRPPATSTAIAYGTLIHSILEEYYRLVMKTGSFFLESQDFDRIYTQVETTIPPELLTDRPEYRTWANAKKHFEHYYLTTASLDSESMEILATEKTMLAPIKGTTTKHRMFQKLGTPVRVSKDNIWEIPFPENIPAGNIIALDTKTGYIKAEVVSCDSGFLAYKPSLLDYTPDPSDYLVTGFFYLGRIDLIVRRHGILACLDHKTTSQSLSLAASNQHWSNQFMGYVWLCQKNGLTDLSEALVNLLQITAYRSKKTGEYGEPKLDWTRGVELYSNQDIISWQEGLTKYLERIESTNKNLSYIRERDSCYNWGSCCSCAGLCAQNRLCGEELVPIDWIEKEWVI